MYITIIVAREIGDTPEAFDLDLSRLHAWLTHSNFVGTITKEDPLRLYSARDTFIRLATLVAKDYPDAADWKDARPILASLAWDALLTIGINPELKEVDEDY